MSLWQDIVVAWSCRCPECHQGELFSKRFDMVKACPECGLDLSNHDIGDGAVVFLIFILGFSVVPLAWVVDLVWGPPLWVHLVVWTAVMIGLTFGLMFPLKSYIVLLQYRHRRDE